MKTFLSQYVNGAYWLLARLSCCITCSSATAETHCSRNIEFKIDNTYSVAPYANFLHDFGNKREIAGKTSLASEAGNVYLRTYLPVGTFGAKNGYILKTNICKQLEYHLEYTVRFSDNFPTQSKGGKLPGLSGGKGQTGGKSTKNGDGFSVRLMWYGTKQANTLKIKPYIYHYDMPGKYGDSIDPNAVTHIKAGELTRIKYYIKLNTADNRDGILKIFVGNMSEPLLESNDLRFKTQDNVFIDTNHISIFAGGSNSEWKIKPTKDQSTPFIDINAIDWK